MGTKDSCNPAVAGSLRQLFANWMGLPAGRHRVRLIENFYVPAADGLPLATDRYEPAGVAAGPTILMRTPYSKGAAGSLVAGLFAYQFATHGYHVVVQDCRGRFGSQGETTANSCRFCTKQQMVPPRWIGSHSRRGATGR